MDKFLNPKIYKRESVEIEGEILTGQYFQDDKGRDWYETLAGWAGAVALDASGIVCAYESDVSYMGMEEGRSVYEVKPADVPPLVVGNFTYKDGEFTDIRPNEIELANRRKVALIQEASAIIAVLQDAVDLGMATEADQTRLNDWKQYRVEVYKLDTKPAPAITWPPQPKQD